MDNSYFTQVAPYFQALNAEDKMNLMPVFQNIGYQQANQNAALQQQIQNNQMAGQNKGNSMGGLSPLAMAAMLRKKKPTDGYGEGTAYSNMTPDEIANMKEHGV